LSGKINEAGRFLGNNLQAAAIRLNPGLANIINICAQKGLPKPVMTGSGGNFFILCQNEEDATRYALILKEAGLNAYPLNSVSRAIEIY
jgi:4-diphosphocytidyl-2C-methyl-D-erythritol kinase